MKPARLAATLVTVVVLAGCSADADPKVEPTESPTSPSSPTTSKSPSSRDRERDLIAEYVQAISEALSSGDPSGFLALSDPLCANCNTIAENLNDAYGGGGRIEGGSWTLQNATYVERSHLGSIWNVNVRSTRERWLAADGTAVKTVRAGLQRLGLAISKEGSDLQVQALRIRS